MFLNISPYLCSNMHEFDDERAYLKEKTFPKIKTYYEKLGINFDPIQIEWNESDDIVKSGSLLRLLLHNIVKSSPFFICLLGKRYGTYLERKEFKRGTSSISSHQTHSNETADDVSSIWIEKNLQVASRTGYDYVVNSKTFNDSFTELQINTAISDENNFSFIRFYYRQIEFLDEKFSDLSIEDRKKAIDGYEAENDYCDFRMKDMKMKIAKKGLIVKYYKSLKELDEIIFNDYVEIIHALINSSLINIEKSKFELNLENYVLNKLQNYMITDSIKELFKNLDTFLKRKQPHNVHFKLDSMSSSYSLSDNNTDNISRSDLNNNNEWSDDEIMQQNNEEYLEILKLRHINLSRSINSIMGHTSNLNDNPNSQRSLPKNIFLITGSRGKGKSSFMALVYQQLYLFKSVNFADSPLLSDSSNNNNNGNLSSAKTNKLAQIEPFYLFYFLRPGDHFISILIDIILKMRLKYLKRDCRYSIVNELFDEISIIEQFHASLCLGPVVIFIDGLSELDRNHTIKLYDWLPSKLEICKFVISLNKSSEHYVDLVNTRSCLIHEINVFSNDLDYKNVFAKFLSVNRNSSNSNEVIDRNSLSKNVLFGKFLTFFDELKTSNHYSNPLFIQMIAQEFFTYDKDIYKKSSTSNNNNNVEIGFNLKTQNNSYQLDPILNDPNFSNDFPNNHDTKSVISSLTANNENLSSTDGSINIINLYIEEVSTLRGIMEKIIKRYIRKNNWSLDNTLPLSPENSGWIGDALCLIALSVHGINKDSIMRILVLKGYVEDLKVNDVNWRLFRMQFGEFIFEGQNGKLTFCHVHFKEAVQTLLMDGFSVVIDFKPDPTGPSCKKNISTKQKEMHTYIIIDLLENHLKKSDFDMCSQLNNKKNLNINIRVSQYYVEILHELLVHLYMIYDLVNLCKLVTSFKVIQIFHDNRIHYLNEWYDFCDYLKLTINFDTLRPILLSSFTIGIPQYVIEQHDDIIFFRNINKQKNSVGNDLDNNHNNTGKNNDENKRLRFSKSELAQMNQQSENLRIFKSPLKSSKALTKSFNSQSNHSISSFLSENRNNFDMTEYYEPLIDILIDLNGMSDLSKSKFGDTYNMLLINRAIVMIDLMKNLGDKYFLEKYAYLLCLNVNNIVVQNYPLNDTEKLKYTSLLQILANISNQMCLFDHSLRYLIKSIEILEDLYSIFNSSDLNSKYKTKIQLYQIGYRLSYLYSNMALMLFKMNELDNIDLLLAKAREYYRNSLSIGVIGTEDFQSSTNSIIKFETESFTELLNRKQSLHNFLNIDVKNKEDDQEDGGIFEARYYYYLVSSLYEVQKMNFKKANNLFQSALSISIKWYGQNHVNTSKIYHYYGCFFSLKDMTFYNPHKAELYLRKALYIREKSKIQNPIENIEKSKYDATTFNPHQFDSISKISNFSSSDENSFKNLMFEDSFLNNSQLIELKSNPVSEKLVLNDEKNTIAEILYDLGCLLATYESNLSKKEAIDFLRRSLDIKVLIFGEKYWDCQVIKKRLNEIVTETTQLNLSMNKLNSILSNRENVSSLTRYSPIYRNCVSSNNNLNNPSSFYRSSSSFKINGEVSPQKSIELIKKQIKIDTSNSLFDKWLEKNSIIEKIPSKQKDKLIVNSNVSNSKTENQSSLNGDNKLSYDQEKSSYLDNEFIQSSIYVDQNTNIKQQDLDKPIRTISEKNETNTTFSILPAKNYLRSKTQHQKENNNLNEVQNKVIENLKLQRSRSHVSNSRVKSTDSYHKRACDCPTALSIDIHNSRSGVNGPNSNLTTLLNEKQTNNNDIKSKIVKHIYYKSAWYDLPHGTNKKRFKTFIKLKPNA